MESDKDFAKKLATRIKSFREDLGLTQRQLAAKMKMTQSALARYETNSRQIPISLLPLFTQALELNSIEELLGVEPRKTKPGPPSKALKLAEKITAMPKSKQAMLLDMLEGAIDKAS